jgi:hypothetical protein
MNAPITEVHAAIAKFNTKSFDGMPPRDMGKWWRTEMSPVYFAIRRYENDIYDSAPMIHGGPTQSKLDMLDKLKGSMGTIYDRFAKIIDEKIGEKVWSY